MKGIQPNIRFVRLTVDWITAPRNSTTSTSINNVTMDKKDGSVIFQVEFSRPMIKMGSPVLKLKVDGTPCEAEYVSGKAESIYRFSYTPKQGESEIEVINVSGKGTSYIGDLFNELPQDVSFRFSLNTVPDTDEPLRADGSMESSQWFRYQDRWYDFWNKGYMAINSMMRGNY